MIGKEDSGAYFVKREDKEQIFKLDTPRVKKLIKKSADLKDETPVAESDSENGSEPTDEGDGE